MVACRKSKFQWSFGSVRTTKTHSFQLCLDSFIFVHADFTSRKGAFMKSSLSRFVTAALFSEFGCMFTDSCLCVFFVNVCPFGDHCSQENINQLECEIFKDSQSFVGPVIWMYEMYVLILWGIRFYTYSSPVHPLLELIHLAPTAISTSSPAQILPVAWLMNSSAGLTLGLMMFRTVE